MASPRTTTIILIGRAVLGEQRYHNSCSSGDKGQNNVRNQPPKGFLENPIVPQYEACKGDDRKRENKPLAIHHGGNRGESKNEHARQLEKKKKVIMENIYISFSIIE